MKIKALDVGLLLLLAVWANAIHLEVVGNPIKHPSLLWAVESRIYHESPYEMLITARKGGLSVWSMAKNISVPQFLVQWNASASVEGIDRVGEYLVVRLLEMKNPFSKGCEQVVDIGSSGLWVWNSLYESFEHLMQKDGQFPNPAGFVATHHQGALHVRLRKEDGIAFVTCGFNTTEDQWSLIAIDVKTLQVVGELHLPLSLGVGCPEGVFLGAKGYIYVGGYCGDALVTIDARDVKKMVFVHTLVHGRDLVEMVSAAFPDGTPWHPPQRLYSALWGEETGGLAVLDVSTPQHPVLLRLVVKESLRRANRVHLHSNGKWAVLPLEITPGAIAVVNIESMKVETRLDVDVNGLVYTCVILEDMIYVMGANDGELFVLRIVN